MWKYTIVWRRVLTAICWIQFLLIVLPSCERVDQHLTEGLEEEKSYTRKAMEYHRQHPDQRREDKVLEAWSAADYVATEVAKQQFGERVKRSDQLFFLPTNLRLDSSGNPFCVIRKAGVVIVLRFLEKSAKECRPDIEEQVDISSIRSGEMAFSGRKDFWIYVLNH